MFLVLIYSCCYWRLTYIKFTLILYNTVVYMQESQAKWLLELLSRERGELRVIGYFMSIRIAVKREGELRVIGYFMRAYLR